MMHIKLFILFSIALVVGTSVTTTSVPAPTTLHLPSLSYMNKLSIWKEWVYNIGQSILGSLNLHPLSLDQRNSTNPSTDLKLDFTDMAALGLPSDWEIDPECQSVEKFFFRTIDGSCNWPVKGEINYGKTDTEVFRDHNDTYFADGFDAPRQGPNPRAISNAFFAKTTNKTEYEHTPILVGLIEFVIHDIVYSKQSKELIEVPIPKCDPGFDPECKGNLTMKVWRSASVEGTGTDPTNPRRTKNGVTTWLDLSALYGSTLEVANKLRTFKGGRLITQVGPDGYEYPPYNTMGLKMFGHKNPSKTFGMADPRANQDWLLMAVETLLIREHNRLCGIFEAQNPHWDDNTIYQFSRVALSVKYQMIANNYQQAYFTHEMPQPWFDGVPLFRMLHGKNMFQMNAFTSFPFWPGLYNNKPVTVSEEMTIGYRFHEILPVVVPLIDKYGKTFDQCHLVETAFDSEGFMNTGLENVLRGMASTQIPRFHTGTSDEYRNMVFNFGNPNETVFYDLVAKTIIHERERGLPTFNQYFAKYTGVPQVKPRKTFEEFTTNPAYLKALKELYSHPDEVDLTVGQYLDETLFPGTTVPRSQLITSLFSLFALGVSDRFSPGYSLFKCLPLVGTQNPFTCTPANAVEYLIWKPVTFFGVKMHVPDLFWFKELSFDDYGSTALWRLITDNSEVKCLQRDPLFPADPVTNPVVCSLDEFYPPSRVPLISMTVFGAFLMISIVLCCRSVKPQRE